MLGRIKGIIIIIISIIGLANMYVEEFPLMT